MSEADTLFDLSVVIPAFNEAERIVAALQGVDAWAAATGRRVEVILVDDGSIDDTVTVARAQKPAHARLRVLTNDRNRGKGHSVRRGMLEAAAPAVLMSDADFSTPIEEVQKLLPHLKDPVRVVIGSRDMSESRLEPPQPLLRRCMGALFRTLRRSLMLGGLRDTQCGFKLFEREAARRIFSLAVEDGFIFDVEALALAQKLGYSVHEVGVLWRDDRRSRVRPVRDAWAMYGGLWRIRRQMRKVQTEESGTQRQ